MSTRPSARASERWLRPWTTTWYLRRRLSCWLLVFAWFSCGWASELRSATPRAADFPELTAAVDPLGDFFAGNVIAVGKETPAYESPQACNPFPAESRILAYEEHRDFVYACGDASQIFGGGAVHGGGSPPPQFVRRILLLKPSVYVVDDFLRLPAGQASGEWLLGCRSQPAIAGRQLRFAGGDQQLVCETLWPADRTLQASGDAGEKDQPAGAYGLELRADAGDVRLLHVFQLLKASDGAAPATSALEEKDGELTLTISTPERTCRLTLPPPGAAAGWVAIQEAGGSELVARRPLASGILPHGPEGVRLMERWDSAYREGRQAPWDTGLVAPPLRQAVESGEIKPCRVIELGCGTGVNAIFLARQGFDVTAIDVAPTALGLAAAEAEKGGVRVRWILADVLALPELGPFDLVFDRGCYHNVRYVDAAGFVASLRRLTRPGTRCLILSCNRDGPPGVREQQMRDDFSSLFEFEWLRDSAIEGRDGSVRRESWSLLMRRKAAPHDP